MSQNMQEDKSASSMNQSFLSHLNREQLRAATSMGRVCVIAGAGTGKTSTLTAAIIDKIVNRRLSPKRIFVSTFTRKSATEMGERIEKCGFSRPRYLGTFHSNARKLIQRFPLLGGGIDTGKLVILDPVAVTNFIKEHIIELMDQKLLEDYRDHVIKVQQDAGKRVVVPSNTAIAKDVASFFSDMKQSGAKQGDLPGLSPESNPYLFMKKAVNDIGYRIACKHFDTYNNRMRVHNAMDFDDLIMVPTSIMKANREIRNSVAEAFDAVFVDEDQDTNNIQDDFISMISGHAKVLFRVGDDGQSIYGWRGSNVEILRQFRNDADVTVELHQNYRSTQNILDYSSALLRYDRESNDKNLISCNKTVDQSLQVKHLNFGGGDYMAQEIESVCSEIRRRLKDDAEPGDIAVLVRANWIGNRVYGTLLKNRIPTTLVGSHDLFNLKIIRYVIGYAMCGLDPDSTLNTVRLGDIFNNPRFPVKGIGERTIDRMIEIVNEEGSFLEGMKSCVRKLKTGEQKRACQRLVDFMENMESRYHGDSSMMMAGSVFDQALQESGLKEYMDDRIMEIDDLVFDLHRSRLKSSRKQIDDLQKEKDELERANEALADFMVIFEDSTIREAMAQIQLSREISRSNSGNTVTVSTIHSAKGLEWNIVHVVGMSNENLFKSDNVAENNEAIRNLYVATTRPRKELIVSGSPLASIIMKTGNDLAVNENMVL